jgi:hypothetical protein
VKSKNVSTHRSPVDRPTQSRFAAVTGLFILCLAAANAAGLSTSIQPQAPKLPSLESVVGLASDDNERRINAECLRLGLGLRQLAENPEYLDFILRECRRSPRGLVSIRSIFARFPDTRKLIESVRSPFATRSGPRTFEQTLDDLRRDVRYEPVVFVPNLEHANDNLPVIVSPGLEVEEDEKGDSIIAWSRQADAWTSLIIDEETATYSGRPLLVISLDPIDQALRAVGREAPRDPHGAGFGADDLFGTSATSFASNEYQINFRFDNSNNSEFCIVAYRIDPNGTHHWIYNANGWKQIADVHKNNVGKQQAKWSFFCGNYTPYNTNFVFFNTYERDWYANEKNLGVPSANNKTLYLSGRRKFDNEWYNFDPSSFSGANHRVPLQQIFNSWAHWYSNGRGNFRVWRVE